MLMMLGWVFAPVYLDLGVFTMPEFLKKRYGGERLKLFITMLSLGLYAFTKVGFFVCSLCFYPSVVGFCRVIGFLLTTRNNCSNV